MKSDEVSLCFSVTLFVSFIIFLIFQLIACPGEEVQN